MKGRYIYAREPYGALRALQRGIEQLDEVEARLARVLLGSILVDCSNIIINGKGRRYRQNWESRRITRTDVFDRFESAVTRAVEDLIGFSCYSNSRHEVYTGDARVRLKQMQTADLAIFSPPYPNSFDYTDVYNLELWMLGYLRSRGDNRDLRSRTLRSHVQIKWQETDEVRLTPMLNALRKALEERREDLWNRNIPEMVMGYFADLRGVLVSLHTIVRPRGKVVVAVGDSQYAGVRIDVAGILAEVAVRCGYAVEAKGEIRSMRASAQHGGGFDLVGNCLVAKAAVGEVTK